MTANMTVNLGTAYIQNQAIIIRNWGWVVHNAKRSPLKKMQIKQIHTQS